MSSNKYGVVRLSDSGRRISGTTLTASAGMGVAATQKIYLDGVAMTGDTYWSESSPDNARLTVGNTVKLDVTANSFLLFNSTARSINGITHGVQIQSSATSNGASLSILRSANDTGAPYFTLCKSRGATPGTYAAVQSGDTTGIFTFAVDDGVDYACDCAKIYAKADGNFTENNTPGRLVLATTSAGASSAVSRIEINSTGQVQFSGNLGLGMVPTAQLELSTDSAKKPSTNTWTVSSDKRLKDNIENADIDRCYEIVKAVPLRRFTWKDELVTAKAAKDRSKLGWIADEVEYAFPKSVETCRYAYNQVYEEVEVNHEDPDGNVTTVKENRLVSEDSIEDCKTLNADQLYAALYGAVQKLMAKVEALEALAAQSNIIFKDRVM